MAADLQAPASSTGLGGFFRRNSAWLRHLGMAGMVVLIAEMAVALVDDPLSPPPASVAAALKVGLFLSKLAALVALGFAGFEARLCDTVAAKVFAAVVLLAGFFGMTLLAIHLAS